MSPIRKSIFLCLLLMAGHAGAGTDLATTERPVDYLTLDAGTVPVLIGREARSLGVGLAEAVAAIDGSGRAFRLTTQPTSGEAVVEIVYALPGTTVFTGFSVVNVIESANRAQAFVSRIEIEGSADNAATGFEPLAATAIVSDGGRHTAELPVFQEQGVRWIRLRLHGLSAAAAGPYRLLFSELVGYGSQQGIQRSEVFTGIWKADGVFMELKQQGATVTGCYDRGARLTGTVQGNVLLATGRNDASGVASTFVLTVRTDERLLGVRSESAAPAVLYSAPPAPTGAITDCTDDAVEPPGCGAIVHGITFEADGITPTLDSRDVLSALLGGLESTERRRITVTAHTSSDGTNAANRRASRRTAGAIVDWLAEHGVDRDRLAVRGRGEDDPIARNDAGAGRALNERIEIRCRD